MSHLRRILVPATVACALVLPISVFASSKPAAVLRVSPKQVRVGASAVVDGHNLHPKTYLTFLLAIPDSQHSRFTRFVSAVTKTDAQGTVKVGIRIPREPYCGKATIYAFNRSSQKMIGAPFTITGCKATGNPGGLPPPPSNPPKKGKHKS